LEDQFSTFGRRQTSSQQPYRLWSLQAHR
jgi:hypothetical protein